MGDHISFVQEAPRDLLCFPMFWAICVVEDVATRLDSDFGILGNVGASSSFTCV